MKNFDQIQKYISIVVVSLYFLAGAYLLTCQRCISMMHREFRVIFGIVLILYGGYRLARILFIKKSDDDEEYDDDDEQQR
ncbi:MAG: hypothetical protein ACP5F6_07025 [Microbacter sp.]